MKMNRIYKVIWSKVRNCYVVVSELAKRNGKCSSSINKKIIASFLAAGVATLAPLNVQAATGAFAFGYGAQATADYAVAIGYYATASGKKAVALGSKATASGPSATAFGEQTQATGDTATAYGMSTTASGDFSTAWGNSTTAAGVYATVWGNNAQATNQSATAWGEWTQALREGSTAFGNSTVSNGSYSTAWGVLSNASGDWSTAFGYKTAAGGIASTAFGESTTASGRDATAFGYNTTASSDGATAFGYNTKASAYEATAWGQYSNAEGQAATAWGYNAKASGQNATAFGKSATASNANATAFGESTTASGTNATTFGYNTTASGDAATAWGKTSEAAGTSSTAFGQGSTANAENSLAALGGTTASAATNSFAIGKGATVNSSDSYVIGNAAQIKDGSSGSVAIGNNSTIGTKASSSLAAVGGTVSGGATHAIAIGNGSSAKVSDSVAIGSGSVAGRGPATIGGYDVLTGSSSTSASSAWKSTLAAVSIGGESSETSAATSTRQITGVAAGYEDTDAVNVAQLKRAASLDTDNRNVGLSINANGNREITSPYIHIEGVEAATEAYNNALAAYITSAAYTGLSDADKPAALQAKINELRNKTYGTTHNSYKLANASGEKSVAIGASSAAAGDYSAAVGYNTAASGSRSNAFGYGSIASGEDSTAIGRYAQAIGNQSIALGYGESTGYRTDTDFYQLISSGYHSIAIGYSAHAKGYGSTSLGQFTRATGINSTALGYSTQASGEGATAFGNSTEAKGNNSTAFGYNAHAIGNNSVAFGGSYEIRTSPNSRFGTLVHSFGEGSTAFGAGSHAVGDYSTAFGAMTKATGKYSTAFGSLYFFYPNGPDSTVYTPVPSGEYVAQLTHAVGDYSTAFGAGTKAIGEYSTTFGALTTATGKYSTAFGLESTAGGDNSLAALGATTETAAANSFAIGKGAKATLADSIALGSEAVANTAAGSVGIDTTGADHKKDATGVWKSTQSAVSIGDAANSKTRQITGLAAGTVDTDAVNVAQLKQLQWNIGTGTTSKSEPSFLKPVGGDKHDVVMRAGDGIRITATERTSGYDIEFSSYFTNLETTVPGGNFIDSITYKGKPYYINGGGSGIVDAISDNRAVIVAPESVDILNDQGEVTGKRHYLKIHSPYININGLSGTEFYDEPQDYFALAQKSGSMAIGIHSKAAEENSTAIGHNADALGLDSTAIGYNSHAHGNNSVAIGIASTTSGNRAIAIGTSASNTSNEDYNPTNPHQGARAAGMGAIALGDRAMVLSSEYLSDDKYVDNPQPDDSVNDAIAIGTRTQARARNAIAVGGDTSYTYKDETGKIVTIYGADDDVQGGRNYGAVVGDGAHSGIAIGGAYGTFDNETKTIHQEMDAAATYGIRGIAIGSGALVANPDDFADLKEALSDPTYVNVKRDFHTARSNHLEAKAEWDAIKDLTINDPSLPEGTRVDQIKYDAAKEKYESTLQKMNEATAKYSMALKEVVRLQVKDSVLEEDAIAIGTLANASIRDSVALGSHSITDSNDKAGSRTGISGYDPLGKASDNDYFRGDNKYSEDDPVWRSTAGSLSVGGTYYKKDTDGNYETDDDGNLVVDKVITRRISHVAAGVKDSDAVNVAQLKRATTISSDSRNTALGVDENGNMIVNSPFLAISGVEESSDNNTIVRKYRNNGGADGYVNGLQQESDEIQGRIDSINATRAEIDKALNGYTDGNGKFVDGIEQKYEKRLALEKQYETGQITRERYLEESADLITVEDYTLHKTEYTDQLIATEARLKDLEESQKVYTDLLADNGKKAKEKYTEAETYFNSQANADGTDSMAVGQKSKAGGKQSIAIGKNNEVGTTGEIENKDSEAIKAKREKEAANSVALGIGNTITGTADTDSSQESMALGVGNTITNANKAMAIGSENTVTGEQSIAIGTGHIVTGSGSGAIGDPNILAGKDSYVIGNNNDIGGTKYTAEDTKDLSSNLFVVGNENTIEAGKEHVYVLGSNVRRTESGSVFLGDSSGYVADNNKTTKGIKEYKSYEGFGDSYEFAGSNPVGVVSVGDYVDDEQVTRRIQNVAAGLISAESTDAINGSQLYAAIQAMSINVVADADKSAKVVRDPETGVGSGGGTGTAATTYTVSAGSTTIQKTSANLSESGNLTIEDVKEGTATDPKSYEYKIDLNKDISVDSVTAGDPAGDSSKLDKNGLTITGGPNGNPVTINNKKVDVAGNKIENVADGQGANDAVNVSQLQNSSISFKGDSGDSGLIKLGDQYNASFNVKGDNNITTEASAGQLNIKLKEQIDLGENGSVTIGNTTVKNNSVAIEGGPSMTDKGIDAGGQKITNVQAGEADTDAVNVGQLKEYAAGNNQAVTNLGNQITGVENRMKKGLAGAAALAALHPMDFDPDDKLTFAAGMGHYRGESAAALGMFYRPDEKVMFSVGGTLGNGENMINAGVSFSLDRTPRVTGSRTALTKEVVQLREHVARQDAQIAELTALVRQLAGNAGMNVPASSALPTEAPALFADNLDNKWVYDAIEDLEQRGYFTGYAGRALTREQIAAALDRAMSGGAKLDERIVKEFEPELSHVRVAHVEGKGNEEGEWYERPRPSHDKLEDKHKIEKKPFRVEEKKITSKS